MRRSFIVSLIVLIVALVSAEDQNLKPLKNSKLLNEALRITFPASGVKQSSNGWNNDNGTKCSDEMTLLQEELTKGSLWALKMIDASSKIPTGVMVGNLVDLGMFDECMEVNVNASGQQIRGRHCMYNLVADLEGQGCVSHTWYLAVEMQFFWISPLILYPLAKKPKIGLGILAAFFVASVVTPVIIGYNNEYSTAVMANRQKSLDKITRNMDDFYYASHIRAAPWLIGVFFGYLIFTQKGSSASKATKWIGWLLAIAAFSFCVLSIRVYQNIDYEYDFVWESIYTTLVRPLWGFAVSWIMYASIRGFGGPVSTLLSLPIYIPLTRISYCVYLVHSQIQFTKARAMRTADYFSPFDAFDHFLSDFMLSIIAGFFFSLVFETPILVLEKIMKKRGGQKKDNSKKAMKVEELEKGIDNSGLTSS